MASSPQEAAFIHSRLRENDSGRGSALHHIITAAPPAGP
jgi:hypothetical protein